MAEEQALVQLMDTLDGLELTKSEYEWLEQRFAAMTEKEQLLFRGAMKLEKPETASEAIDIAGQLHCYELFYSAGDEDALGQFVMKHLEQVPDAARLFLSRLCWADVPAGRSLRRVLRRPLYPAQCCPKTSTG